MESWYSDATLVESVEIDIFFPLRESLFGPDHDPDGAQSRSRDRLELPDFPRKSAQTARTAEAVGHESALAAYYRQVWEVASRDGLQMRDITHLFWLRLSRSGCGSLDTALGLQLSGTPRK